MNRAIIQETARFTRAAHRHPAVVHLLLSSSHEISAAWGKYGRGKDSHWHQLGVDPPARIGRYWYQRQETRDSVADLDLIMRWRVKQGVGEQSWLPPSSSHDLQRQQAKGMISRGHICISSIDAAAAVARDDARVQVLDCEVEQRRISLSGRFAALVLQPFGDDRAILQLWQCGLQTKQAGLLWSAGNAHRACFANGGALAPNATAAGASHAEAKQSVVVWSELYHDMLDGQLRARSVRWKQAAQDEDGGSTGIGSGALVVPSTTQFLSQSPAGRLLFADCSSSKDEGSLFVSLSDRTTIESWVAIGSRFESARIRLQPAGQEQRQDNGARRMIRLLTRSIGGQLFPESTDSHVYALTDVPARGSTSWNRAQAKRSPADAGRSSTADASMDAEVAREALREERAVYGGAAPLRIVRASFSQILGSGQVHTVGCPAPIGCDDDLEYAPGTVDSMLPLWDWEELQVVGTHEQAAADWQTVDYDLYSQPATDASTLTTLKQAGADRSRLRCKPEARPPVMVQYQLCGQTGRPRVIASTLPPHGTEADSDQLQVRQLQAVELPSMDDAVGIEARSNDDPSSPVVRYIIKRGAGQQVPVDVVLYCDSSGVLRNCSLPMTRSSTIFEKTSTTANNTSSAKPTSLLGRLASAVQSVLPNNDQDDVERNMSLQPPRLGRASTVATVHSHKASSNLQPNELEVIAADAIRGHTKRSPKSFQTEWVARQDLQQARDTIPPTQLKLQTRYEQPLELASRRLSVPVRYGAENLDFGMYESLLERKGALAPESVPITVTGHPDALSCFEDTLHRGCTSPESEYGAGHFPVAVSVYGCYGVSLNNSFDVGMLPFYLRGGVMVYAHVRGGGERGQAWHAAGRGPVGKALAAHDLAAVLRIASAACGDHSVGLVAESAGGVLAGWALACKASGVHSHAWLPPPAALPAIEAAFLSCPFVDLGGAAAAHRDAANRDNTNTTCAAGGAGYEGIAGDALFAQELSEWGDPAAPGGQGNEAFELLRGLCPTSTARQGRVNKGATADVTSQPRVVLTTGELDLRVPADTVLRFGEALRGVGCNVTLIGNSGPGSGHLNDNGAIEIADGASEVQEKAVRSAFLSAVLSPGASQAHWPRSGFSN